MRAPKCDREERLRDADDNPWPGLESFSESQRRLFFGRERETDELARLVRRETLTVLFGQSGLGRSSLIQAGLFPLLRENDHLPLYLRLDHSGEFPIAEQVKAALNARVGIRPLIVREPIRRGQAVACCEHILRPR